MSLTAPERGRDDYVDALRGVCIVSMLIVHFCAPPFAFRISLSGVLGYVSGAEGFVFLSGLVFSQVYGTRLRERGVGVAGRSVLARWLWFYGLHLLTIAATVLCGAVFPDALVGEDPAFGLAVRAPWTAMGLAALLGYYPQHMGILPIYIMLMPFAWLLVWRGWAGKAWVPIASILLWLAQATPHSLVRDHTTLSIFSPLGYQVLFFLGLWLGAQRWDPPFMASRFWLWLAAGLALACFVASHLRMFLVPREFVESFRAALEWPLDKTSLGWLRIANFLPVAYLCFYFRKRLERLPLGYFAALGRHSLSIFIGHLVFFLVLVEFHAHLRAKNTTLYNAYMLGCIAVATTAIWAVGLLRSKRTRLRHEPAEAPLAQRT